MEGFIQIHRKILEWEWYDDIPTKVLFLHILFTANYTLKNWRGVDIKPGQLLTGRKSLSEQTGLSEQQIRTSLEKLKSTGEVTAEVTNKYTILTLTNWSIYNQQDSQRITKNQPTNNQQITTTNKGNNINKENKEITSTTEIVASQPNEYQESMKFLKSIDIDNIRNIEPPEYAKNHQKYWVEFVLYWTEKGKTGKIRAEGQKTFEIKRRFYTWLSHAKVQFEKPQQKFNTIG